jgi:hypothetical protein
MHDVTSEMAVILIFSAVGTWAERHNTLIADDEAEEMFEIKVVVYFKVRHESSVHILTRLWSGRSRFDFRQQQIYFFPSQCPDTF